MHKNEAQEIIKKLFAEGRPKITLSNPVKKSMPMIKITITPIKLKNGDMFQLEFFTDKQVTHENLDADTAALRVIELLTDYKLCDIYDSGFNYKILSNSKSSKLIKKEAAQNPSVREHNNEKKYIIKEGEPIAWLICLGLMDDQGRIYAKSQKKFRQLNRYLEMIDDIEKNIPANAEIVDFGCGKAYLTFALFYYFNILKNRNVRITGLDLKSDIVSYCNSVAKEAGFSRLSFVCGDISGYKHNREKINMVVSLHACDTATDFSIYNAYLWGADVILAVPCCQHELFSQIKNKDIGAITAHGILKERYAALLTDAVRARTLEIIGYKTDVIEFIDLEHTPKNIMIRAVKKKSFPDTTKKIEELERLMTDNCVSQTLFNLTKHSLKR